MRMTQRIAFFIYPGFQQLDVSGPLTAFEIAERLRPGSYSWSIVAPGSKASQTITSTSGVPWVANPLPRLNGFDTLLIAGGEGVDDIITDRKCITWMSKAIKRSARVASVCSGSFLLAAAGALDGKVATTHWHRSKAFAEKFPKVKLDTDKIFVRDGNLWTSGGVCAGIDLALAIIAEDLGEKVARYTARMMVVYYRRPGGQSQFSELLEMEKPVGRFAELLDYVRSKLHERHSVNDLAEYACMSPRNFARAFLEETGNTPANAVERLRVETARAALESGSNSIQSLAASCGFGNTERMRRSFQRLLGISPSAIKRQLQPQSQQGSRLR
jgi:transcriptional regulator GlxA family with amidase domain